MSLESVTAAIRAKAALAPALGHRVIFDLGEAGVVHWDGTESPPLIGNERGEAETTLALSLADMEKLVAGDLDATLAYMTGRLKIAGSMGIALKVNQLLSE